MEPMAAIFTTTLVDFMISGTVACSTTQSLLMFFLKARLYSVGGNFHKFILQVGSFTVPAVEPSNVGGKVPL